MSCGFTSNNFCDTLGSMSAPRKTRHKLPPNPITGMFEREYDPEFYMPIICGHLEKSLSLQKTCKLVGGPSSSVVIKWVTRDEKWRTMYENARRIGYAHLADELVDIADNQVAVDVDANGNPVTRRFDQIDVMMTKHRIDTRKWMLAKMLPRVYGDRNITEHVGLNGGPMQIAALDFKGLSGEELSSLQSLLAKAGT